MTLPISDIRHHSLQAKSRRKNGQASYRYSPKGIHQIRSLVRHSTIVASGHWPVRMSWARPIGPSALPSRPTAASSQPRSGSRATSK